MSANASFAPLWVQETKGYPVEGYTSAAGEEDEAVIFPIYAAANYYRDGGRVGTYVGSNFAEWFLHRRNVDNERAMLNPSKAMELWKAAYDARTPTGMSSELWIMTHAIASVTDTIIKLTSTQPSPFANPRNPLLAFLRSGLFQYCQRIISEDTFLDEHPFFIWRVLDILSAICITCPHVDIVPPAFKKYIPARDDVIMMPAKFWKMASSRRDIFLDGDLYDRTFPGSASKLRERLSTLILNFCPLLPVQINHKRDMEVKGYESLRRLALLAWFHGPLDRPNTASYSDLLLETACTFWAGHQLPTGQFFGLSDEDVLDIFDKDVINVYGPVPFLSRLRTTLEAAEERDPAHLTSLLRETSRGLLHRTFRQHLVPSGVLELMMRHYKKIFEASLQDADDMSVHISLFPMALPFLNGLSKDAGIDHIVLLLLRDYDVMLWMSAGVLSNARIGAMNPTAIQAIIRTYQSIGAQAKRNRREDAAYSLLQASLQRVWYGTLATLYELQHHTYSARRDDLIVSWRRFGSTYELNEDAEKKDFIRHSDKLCSWTSCLHHVSFTKASNPNCKGCGKARYCSRECQKRDWKVGGHKAACQRLKDAPASAAK